MTVIKNFTIVFLFILCARALPAQETINLTTKDGREIALETRLVKNSTHIALKELTRILSAPRSGFVVEWDETFGVLRFTQGQDSYSLFLDKTTLLVNSKIQEVSEPVRLVSGDVLIPLSSLKTLNTMWNLFTFSEEKGIKEKEKPAPSPRDTGSRVQPTSTPRSAPTGFLKIVIDPASEPLKWDKNAPGTPFTPSQDVLTRDIAMKVKNILDQETGIEVMFTHREGEILTMEQNIERINTSGAHALVALRLEASRFENLEGVEIYVASESVDPASRDVKKSSGALPLPVAYVPFQKESLALATAIQEEMERAGSIRAGSITPAPAYLLKRAAMPSILVSCGYISNPGDASRLSREKYRGDLARAIAGAILKYRDSRNK